MIIKFGESEVVPYRTRRTSSCSINFNRSCNSFTKSFNDKADKDPEVRDEEADEDLVEEAVLGSQSKPRLWDPLM